MDIQVVEHKLPIKLADGNYHMYPTKIDMVYAEDGKTPIFDKQSGDWTANNALNLGGRPAEDYALKNETGGSGVPAGGSAGQTLVKQSNEDGDAEWADMDLVNIAYTDAENEGIDEDGNILIIKADDSDKLGGKPPKYYKAPRNLFDNGDFLVAQAGRPSKNESGEWISGLHGTTPYAADRWIMSDHLSVSHDGVGLTATVDTSIERHASVRQIVDIRPYKGRTVTMVAHCKTTNMVRLYAWQNDQAQTDIALAEYNGDGSDDGVYAMAFYIKPDLPSDEIVFAFYPDIRRMGGTTSGLRLALYASTYNAETAPPFMSKGYAAEVAECRRYYRQSFDGNDPTDTSGVIVIPAISTGNLQPVIFDSPMRDTEDKPSVTVYSYLTGAAGAVTDWVSDTDITGVGLQTSFSSNRGFMINKSSTFTQGKAYAFHYAISMDL